MRKAAAADRAQGELSAKTGLHYPAMIAELDALGFTPETISVLPLVLKLARERGIAEGSAADRQLSDWMARQPSADVFARATRLIRAMLDSGSGEAGTMSADDLIKYSESIAAASGGILGIGKVSSEERETLANIVAALKAR